MRRLTLALCITALLAPAARAGESVFQGRVRGADGTPLVGAMVSFERGSPLHRVTVFSGEQGSYRSPPLPGAEPYRVRVRHLGWRDTWVEGPRPGRLDLRVERETDPAQLAAQLPANHWYKRVLDRIDDPAQREELVRQCTFCHQQGNEYTRRLREPEEWRKVIVLMGRRGAMLSSGLREKLPQVFNAAYDPETAVPELSAALRDGGLATPSPEVRRAVIEEWDLGAPGSMQHDVVWHPRGYLYGVDMPYDKLHRLDPRTGERRSWDIPTGDLPVGGVFAARGAQQGASDSRVGPHSLQVGPDGAVWITLAMGNRLARFDVDKESFEIHELEAGFYPHTLRFDQRGRIWYTLSASNHLGMFDTKTGEHRAIRLPARTWTQEAILRGMPFLLWLGRHVDLRGEVAEGEPVNLPVPYGVDVAPDGSVWFSQLNEHRIGRADPDTFEIEVIDTPFPGPRRLRFDSKGVLWIPAFSASKVASFDPRTREFREWEIPVEPRGSETPYALHVDRRTDTVWICGTSSDSLIRFEPATERWTQYPLPTRVTYTREIDFDAEGRVWTSNSNSPAWQIEGGIPRVVRLDPRDALAPPQTRAAGGEGR